jgi:thioredoxin reductase (NADPH)
MAVDGVFIAIGHKPATELFKGQLPFKQGGYLITEPWTPPRPRSKASSRRAT